ncbi:hypothetical protein C2S51_023241 [Perilla frutescens var. frutescens]|nr:hypothetical protein C2S51_023241 [Perilla frutescens var. frutescens]
MAAAPFDSNKSGKWRMDLSEEKVGNNDDVRESSVIVLSEGTIDVPVLDWDTALKMNYPLPSLPHQQLPIPQIPADLPQLLPLPPLSQILTDHPQLPPLPPLPQIPLPQLPLLPLFPQFPLPDLHHHQKQKSITPPAKSRVSLTLDIAIEKELKRGLKLDPNMDTKTLRRLAARRSRMRRSGYIHDLEMKMKDLEQCVKNLKAQAEFYNENMRLIQEENNSLRRAIDIRANEAKIGKNYMEEMQRLIISLKENLANYPLINEDDEGKSFLNPLIIPPAEEMEMMQESVTISTKPYTIEFYEQHLKQTEMNHDHQNDHQPLIHAAQSESEADESFVGMINFDDIDEEGEGVDQYLNLDEMLNLGPN